MVTTLRDVIGCPSSVSSLLSYIGWELEIGKPYGSKFISGEESMVRSYLVEPCWSFYAVNSVAPRSIRHLSLWNLTFAESSTSAVGCSDFRVLAHAYMLTHLLPLCDCISMVGPFLATRVNGTRHRKHQIFDPWFLRDCTSKCMQCASQIQIFCFM